MNGSFLALVASINLDQEMLRFQSTNKFLERLLIRGTLIGMTRACVGAGKRNGCIYHEPNKEVADQDLRNLAPEGEAQRQRDKFCIVRFWANKEHVFQAGDQLWFKLLLPTIARKCRTFFLYGMESPGPVNKIRTTLAGWRK